MIGSSLLHYVGAAAIAALLQFYKDGENLSFGFPFFSGFCFLFSHFVGDKKLHPKSVTTYFLVLVIMKMHDACCPDNN